MLAKPERRQAVTSFISIMGSFCSAVTAGQIALLCQEPLIISQVQFSAVLFPCISSSTVIGTFKHVVMAVLKSLFFR